MIIEWLKTLFFSLLAGTLLLGASHGNAAENNPKPKTKVAFLLFAGEHDSLVFGDPTLTNGYWIQRMEKLFPGAQILTVNANSNYRVSKRLDQLLMPNDEIVGLVINSHGDQLKRPDGAIFKRIEGKGESEGLPKVVVPNDLPEFLGPKCEPAAFNKNRDFFLVPTDPLSVMLSISPLMGRFSKNAKVIFTGCDLLAFCTTNDAFAAMNETLELLGISQGSVYMNENEGRDIVDVHFHQPFYARDTWSDRWETLKLQSIGLWIYREERDKDLHVYNQGFVLEKNPHGSRLIKAGMFEAFTHFKDRSPFPKENVVLEQ